MKFTNTQNKVLSEIYRRLNYFHKGDLDTKLLFLALPSEAKKISKFGFIKPESEETPKEFNWYNLTEDGKKFFSNYVTKNKLSEDINLSIFEQTYTKSFDNPIINK